MKYGDAIGCLSGLAAQMRLHNACVLLLVLGMVAACGPSQEEMDGKFVDAAKSGDLAEAQRLLQEGAHLDARDAKHGSPAVVWAAHEGHVDVLNMLLDAGGEIEIAAKGKNDTALWYAAQQGQLSTAQILIDRGANTNPIGPDGTSAVAIAENNGYPAIATLLKAHGGH